MENRIVSQPNRKKGGYFKFFILLLLAVTFFSLSASQANAELDPKSYAEVAPDMKDFNPLTAAADGLAALALSPILGIVSIIQSLATTIFRWVTKPENIRFVLGADSNYLYAIWAIVRDFLNLAFIMVLLFIAFSTVFHVEKYNYKKLLWRLIIMALLVNFSYAIARFIIDISNVLMYTLIDMLFQGGSDAFGKSLIRFEYLVNFGKIWAPGSSATVDMLIAIIFGFIFAMTLLVVAMMFVIRMIALAILIIFSPVAFVASIIPATAGYADKWWSNLFKYAFFAPIMVFMIFISVKITEQLALDMQGRLPGYQSVDTIATSEASAEKAGAVAQLTVAVIPIVILWMGMGMAQSMSIAGAGAVLKGVKGAGKSMSGLGYAQKQWKSYQKSRDERQAQKDKKGPGKLVGDWANRKQDSLIAKVPGMPARITKGAKERLLDTERQKAHEKMEEWKKMGGPSKDQIEEALKPSNKDTASRKAAAMAAVDKVGFKDEAQYQQAFEAVKDDPVYKKLFEEKSKEKHIKFVIDSEVREANNAQVAATGMPLSRDQINATYEKHMGGMNADQIAKQKDIHSNANFHNYVHDVVITRNWDTELLSETAKKMSLNDRKAWRNANIIQ